jgi:hypothetical protein
MWARAHKKKDEKETAKLNTPKKENCNREMERDSYWLVL